MFSRLALGLALVAGVACTPGRQPLARAPDQSPPPAPQPVEPIGTLGEIGAPGAPAPTPVAHVAAGPLHATSPVLSLSVLAQFGTIYPAAGELNVLLRIKGVDRQTTERPPLDLALVIDRSGSMSGDKIVSTKTAAIELLSRLDERDRLTLITYSNGVEELSTHVPMTATGKVDARKRIMDIHAAGSTALGPAMAQAFSTLRSRPSPADDRMAHVIFMSDGLANTGEQQPDILGEWAAAAFRDGISLSSLGVGLDYNEDLMTHIADQGGGRYHFIKDSDSVAGVLNDEFKGLVATVASQVAIDLDLPEGVSVLRVFGYPTFEEGGRTFIRVGSVGANATREIIVKLGFDRPMGPNNHMATVARLRVDFRDQTNDGTSGFVTGSVEVSVKDDEKSVVSSENLEVSVRVSETEAADKLETAARAVDRGAFAEAESVLEDTIVELKRKNIAAPSARLEAQIQNLEGARSGVKGAAQSPAGKADYVKGNKARAYDIKKR